jgi:hypothetical protein
VSLCEVGWLHAEHVPVLRGDAGHEIACFHERHACCSPADALLQLHAPAMLPTGRPLQLRATASCGSRAPLLPMLCVAFVGCDTLPFVLSVVLIAILRSPP